MKLQFQRKAIIRKVLILQSIIVYILHISVVRNTMISEVRNTLKEYNDFVITELKRKLHTSNRSVSKT